MNAYAEAVAQLAHEESEHGAHGVWHVVVRVDPFDGWGVLGLAFLGGGTMIYWHTRKYLKEWVGGMVKKQLEKQKEKK